MNYRIINEQQIDKPLALALASSAGRTCSCNDSNQAQRKCFSGSADSKRRLNAESFGQSFQNSRNFLWGDSLWADGYFAETVGRVDESVVRKYIREQRK